MDITRTATGKELRLRYQWGVDDKGNPIMIHETIGTLKLDATEEKVKELATFADKLLDSENTFHNIVETFELKETV